MDTKDFPHNGTLKSNSEDFHPDPKPPSSKPNDFFPQSMPPFMGFSQDQFQPNYMGLAPQYGMFYQPYPNPYSPHPYNYTTSPYKNNNNYSDKKNYQGYRKSYSPMLNTQQEVYPKKPRQQMNQAEADALVEDFKKLNVKDDGTVVGNEMTEKSHSKLENAKFYVIKSYSEEDVHKAIKYNVWCSTRFGNLKLNEAFIAAGGKYPIFLLFSVNASGHFIGVAQMKSTVDFEKDFYGWNQNQKWKGVFKISWMYIKDLPNRELRHLKNELNEGKPVPNSRDCQEVPFEIGVQVLEIFEKYKHQTSILDDFEFYEVKETTK